MEKIDRFKDDYWFLSNFSEYPVYYQGRIWPTAEHAYQAMKTSDLDLQEEIRKAATPGIAKKKGRKVKLRKGWEALKYHIMTESVMSKFKQNPDIAKKLVETGDAHLAEGNDWGDTYWGTVNGKGQNKLGHILMYVRNTVES